MSNVPEYDGTNAPDGWAVTNQAEITPEVTVDTLEDENFNRFSFQVWRQDGIVVQCEVL